MRSLRELQARFARGVLFEESAIVTDIVARGIEPASRLSIYRNNAREGFLKALEATFPVIVRLAGLDWFRQTGTQYMQAHPSSCGNLHYIGQQFAAFLHERLRDSAYAYFADGKIAQLDVVFAADDEQMGRARREIDGRLAGALWAIRLPDREQRKA